MYSPLRPLKALGQHFLNSPEIASRIAGSLSNSDAYTQILEIGPGTGVLTAHLITQTQKELFCIEVDDRSVEYLQKEFPSLKNHIIHGDFLSAPLEAM